MDNIVELEGRELDYLIAVAQMAKTTGTPLRVAIDGGLKIARGQSMWSAPLNNGNNQ